VSTPLMDIDRAPHLSDDMEKGGRLAVSPMEEQKGWFVGGAPSRPFRRSRQAYNTLREITSMLVRDLFQIRT